MESPINILRNVKVLVIAVFSIVLVACGHENCDHDHNGHDHGDESHEGHNHDDHSGHDYGDESHEEHNHDDHEGQDHGDESHESHDHSTEDDHADEISFSKEQAKLIGLKTERVELGAFEQVIRTSGKIQASQGDEALISATSNGIISFVNPSISDGDYVKSGASIVTISAKELLDGDPIEKAKIAYETAQKEMQRANALIKERIISAKEYEKIKEHFETTKTIFEAQGLKSNAKGVKISSPISGYVKTRFVRQGEYVSVGQPIAAVSQNKRLQLRAEVSESNYIAIRNIYGANFKTAYDNSLYKLSELNGKLLSYGKSSQRNSFYIPVTFEFDNVGDIIPGSFTEVFLLANPQNEVISIPVASLSEEQGLYYVYLRLEDEIYKKQEVTLGHNNGDRVLVLAGVNVGDEVVVNGVTQVKLASVSSVIPHGHSH